MNDLAIVDLTGGMNNSDPPIALPDNQCVLAQNVEYIDNTLGERRKGSTAISLAGAAVASRDRISWLHRHLPSEDESASELWALGVSAATISLSRKTTAWSDVSMSDALTNSGVYPYRVVGQTLHGKLFIAYKSSVNRLHVWDGTSLRRVGIDAPGAAPTAADTAVAGSFTGTRYYRVRYTVQSGGTTLRRSEPSAVRTFSPNGSFNGATVTKPATINESETHWELEASTDNTLFYRIATTVVGTTTVTDTTSYATGYGSFTLSEDIGDYTLLPSARYLVADEDRIVFGGHWETASLMSQVGWTPVNNADGSGNDERMELDTDPTLNLDGQEGGGITGMSQPATGSIWVFKQNHIYKLLRSGQRSAAYTALLYTKKRGALHGSVVEAVDEAGNPCVYFLDPKVGPCLLGSRGLQTCGTDIRRTWRTVNVNATKTVCTALFYPENYQVHWWIATGSSNIPDTHIVLHVRHMEFDPLRGYRKGWAIWTGPSAGALTSCLYAENIDDNTTRSLVLKPFLGLEGNSLVHRTDTGDADNGTEYTASIKTRIYMNGDGTRKFGINTATLVGEALASTDLTLKMHRDFGLETVSVTSISLAPTASETHVIKQLDNFSMSELTAVQFEITDPGTPGANWGLDALILTQNIQQTNFKDGR